MLVVETIARIRREYFVKGAADQGDRAGREGLALTAHSEAKRPLIPI